MASLQLVASAAPRVAATSVRRLGGARMAGNCTCGEAADTARVPGGEAAVGTVTSWRLAVRRVSAAVHRLLR